jgi:hypothetical protein
MQSIRTVRLSVIGLVVIAIAVGTIRYLAPRPQSEPPIPAIQPDPDAPPTATRVTFRCPYVQTTGHAGDVRNYDIPGGEFVWTIVCFSEESGMAEGALATYTSGVVTPPVKGRMTAIEVLAKMLEDTNLEIWPQPKPSDSAIYFRPKNARHGARRSSPPAT